MTRRSRVEADAARGPAASIGMAVKIGSHGGDRAAARSAPSPSGRGAESTVRPSFLRAGGSLVELVRLIMVILFAVAGWEVATNIRRESSTILILGIVIGSGIGYVLGGAFGRRTASAVNAAERELGRVPAADVLAGAIGLTMALVVAVLVSIPLFHLPAAAAYPTVAFVYLTMGFVGVRIGRSRSEDLFGLLGVKPKAAGTRAGEVNVLDSSAILDGRMLPLIQMGYLGGSMLVAREVLDELQAVADSSDPAMRTRGRRGLDLLLTLKRLPSVDVVLVEDPTVLGEPVDSRLVRLARQRGGVLVTNDAALAKLASALEVQVRSIHALADALRAPMLPGERISLRLTRRGREASQGVGYTNDGTMVVVEDGERLVGQAIEVEVTNVIHTSTGLLAFGKLASSEAARSS